MMVAGLYDNDLLSGTSSDDEDLVPIRAQPRLAGTKRRRRILNDNYSSKNDETPPDGCSQSAIARTSSSPRHNAIASFKRRRLSGNWSTSEDDDDSSVGSICIPTMAWSADQSSVWLRHETTALKSAAKRYGGTAMQFRVGYSTANVENSLTKDGASIPPECLIVQSQVVTAMGKTCYQTFHFLQWKLPSKKSSRSIYKTIRPRFTDDSVNGNTRPTIAMDDGLHPVIQLLVTTFVNEAKPGTTPLDFYGQGNHGELYYLSSKNPSTPRVVIDQGVLAGKRQRVSAYGENLTSPTKGDTSSVDESQVQDSPFEEDNHEADQVVLPGKRQRVSAYGENLTSPTKGDISSVDESQVRDSRFEEDNHEMTAPFDDQRLSHASERSEHEDGAIDVFADDHEPHQESTIGVNLTPGQQQNDAASPKQSFWSSLPWPLSSKKPPKVYGGSKTKPPTSMSFEIGGPTTKQFLVLVEGLAESTESTLVASNDHMRDIFMHGELESIPTKGRLVELLPNEALPGSWTAQTIGAEGIASRVSGLLRNSTREMRGVRISVRHQDYLELGRLSETKRMFSPDSSGSKAQLHISTIDPSQGRRKAFYMQGLLGDGDDAPVVASISIATCEGCTSMAEANSKRAGELASGLLAAARNKCLELAKWPPGSNVDNLLAIPSERLGEKEPTVAINVGVSFLCKIMEKESYRVLVAQDEEGRMIAIDVVFDQSDSRESISSHSTSSPQPKLTAANIERFTTDTDTSQRQGRNEASDLLTANCRSSDASEQGDVSEQITPGDFKESAKLSSLKTTVYTPATNALLQEDRDTLFESFARKKDVTLSTTAITPSSRNQKETGSPESDESVSLQRTALPKDTEMTPNDPKTLFAASKSLLSPEITSQPTLPLVTPYYGRNVDVLTPTTPQVHWQSPLARHHARNFEAESSSDGEQGILLSSNKPCHGESFEDEESLDVGDESVGAGEESVDIRRSEKAASELRILVIEAGSARNMKKIHSRLRVRLAILHTFRRFASFCLLCLGLLALSRQFPDRHLQLDPFQRHRMPSLQTGRFSSVLDSQEGPTRGVFSVVGSEWVSVTAFLFILATFTD